MSLHNVTGTAAAIATDVVRPFLLQVYERYLALITAPFKYTDMVWIVIPMLATLILMEFYFGRYEDEELGWNTAVGNSIVLVFVSIDLFRQTYQGDFGSVLNLNPEASVHITTVIAAVVGLLGIFLLFFDFFHLLPKKVAFFISSSLPINVIAYLSIVLVYTNLPYKAENVQAIALDYITFIAALLLFISLLIFFWLIHLIEPKSRESLFMRDMQDKAKDMEKQQGNFMVEE